MHKRVLLVRLVLRQQPSQFLAPAAKLGQALLSAEKFLFAILTGLRQPLQICNDSRRLRV